MLFSVAHPISPVHRGLLLPVVSGKRSAKNGDLRGEKPWKHGFLPT